MGLIPYNLNFDTNVPPISVNVKEYSESNNKLEELELIEKYRQPN